MSRDRGRSGCSSPGPAASSEEDGWHDRLAERTIAVLGFGNQGEAQALNLRDAGMRGDRGRARRRRRRGARARAGFETLDARRGRAARAARRRGAAAGRGGAGACGPALAAAAGAGARRWSSPTASTCSTRRSLPRARRRRAGLAHRPGPRAARAARARRDAARPTSRCTVDASGAAWELAAAYAAAGCGCAPLWRTTVREETEVDLFGEQAVLCGGMNALVTRRVRDAGRGRLRARDRLPRVRAPARVPGRAAARARHRRAARRAISGTALFGDLTRGPRVVGDGRARGDGADAGGDPRGALRARMGGGSRARGGRGSTERTEQAARHPIEEARRRALGRPRTRRAP